MDSLSKLEDLLEDHATVVDEIVDSVVVICDKLSDILIPGSRFQVGDVTYGVERFALEDRYSDLFCLFPAPPANAPVTFSGIVEPGEYYNLGGVEGRVGVLEASLQDYLDLASIMPELMDNIFRSHQSIILKIQRAFGDFVPSRHEPLKDTIDHYYNLRRHYDDLSQD